MTRVARPQLWKKAAAPAPLSSPVWPLAALGVAVLLRSPVGDHLGLVLHLALVASCVGSGAADTPARLLRDRRAARPWGRPCSSWRVDRGAVARPGDGLPQALVSGLAHHAVALAIAYAPDARRVLGLRSVALRNQGRLRRTHLERPDRRLLRAGPGSRADGARGDRLLRLPHVSPGPHRPPPLGPSPIRELILRALALAALVAAGLLPLTATASSATPADRVLVSNLPTVARVATSYPGLHDGHRYVQSDAHTSKRGRLLKLGRRSSCGEREVGVLHRRRRPEPLLPGPGGPRRVRVEVRGAGRGPRRFEVIWRAQRDCFGTAGDADLTVESHRVPVPTSRRAAAAGAATSASRSPTTAC